MLPYQKNLLPLLNKEPNRRLFVQKCSVVSVRVVLNEHHY
jgi:hypothetical protein